MNVRQVTYACYLNLQAHIAYSNISSLQYYNGLSCNVNGFPELKQTSVGWEFEEWK